MRIQVLAFCVAFTMLLTPSAARAEASGPDFWDVTGVRADDVLNLHAEASARSRTIAGIPHDAKGLKNLGCTGTPTLQQWSRMSENERIRSARARWCLVEHGGKKGWVAGRFLAEGGPLDPQRKASSIGPWTVTCAAACSIEQTGIGSSRPTVLRLEPGTGDNARITIERRSIARSGKLTVYMDGQLVSQGPITPLAGAGSGRLVMAEDDITAGLLRQMKAHKNMVVAFPGEERGVEIHLDQFEEAWRQARRGGKR